VAVYLFWSRVGQALLYYRKPEMEKVYRRERKKVLRQRAQPRSPVRFNHHENSDGNYDGNYNYNDY